MPTPFTLSRLTSIHGRRLSLNSDGKIIDKDGYAAVVYNSDGVVQGETQASVASSVSATLTNYGREIIASGTATAVTMEIALPPAGAEKTIQIRTSASEFTLGGTATGMVFQPALLGAGSSLFMSAVNLCGRTIQLLAISSGTNAEWTVTGSTATMTIG